MSLSDGRCRRPPQVGAGVEAELAAATPADINPAWHAPISCLSVASWAATPRSSPWITWRRASKTGCATPSGWRCWGWALRQSTSPGSVWPVAEAVEHLATNAQKSTTSRTVKNASASATAADPEPGTAEKASEQQAKARRSKRARPHRRPSGIFKPSRLVRDLILHQEWPSSFPKATVLYCPHADRLRQPCGLAGGRSPAPLCRALHGEPHWSGGAERAGERLRCA